jgi:hypothetical protein
VNTVRWKTYAFTLSAAISGLRTIRKTAKSILPCGKPDAIGGYADMPPSC